MVKAYLELGVINGTHGVKGEMRFTPWCDSPEFAARFKTLYFDCEGKAPVKVLSSRVHGNVVLIALDGIDSVEKAQTMRGKVLFMRRSDAKLPKGTWFVQELTGCTVLDADTGECYGTLTDVSVTGANDVWHITSQEGTEYLIPAIPDVVIDTDVAQNRITIRPLKGIFDDAH